MHDIFLFLYQTINSELPLEYALSFSILVCPPIFTSSLHLNFHLNLHYFLCISFFPPNLSTYLWMRRKLWLSFIRITLFNVCAKTWDKETALRVGKMQWLPVNAGRRLIGGYMKRSLIPLATTYIFFIIFQMMSVFFFQYVL